MRGISAEASELPEHSAVGKQRQAKAGARLCTETARPRSWVLAEEEVGPWGGRGPGNTDMLLKDHDWFP